jgi:hypothetical protein
LTDQGGHHEYIQRIPLFSSLYFFIDFFFSGCSGGKERGIVLMMSADPVEQGKEATALGFKVPFDILSAATKVIK